VRDMQVVELVESVLVEVLGVEPDEVVPHATVRGDLGAREADILRVVQQLGPAVCPVQAQRLTGHRVNGSVDSFTVEALVDLVEAGPLSPR
jgi:hypothetical protein